MIRMLFENKDEFQKKVIGSEKPGFGEKPSLKDIDVSLKDLKI